jgi:hypothetical protein
MISALFFDTSALKANIIVIDEMHHDVFASSDVVVHRVIIDEVDNINQLFIKVIPCKHIWFVSASFSAIKLRKTPYKITPDQEENIFCRCDPEFVARSLKLTPHTEEVILCDDTDFSLFKDIVPDNCIDSLHACNKRPLQRYIGILSLYGDNCSLHELAEWYLKQLQLKVKELQDDVKKCESLKVLPRKKELIQEQLNSTQKCLVTLQNNIKDHQHHQLQKHHSPKKNEIPKGNFTKNYRINHEILERLKTSPKNKWLIYNSDTRPLIDLQKLLTSEKNRVTCVSLSDKGLLPEKVADYKQHTQVCLINSIKEGCGLNLENTDTILFMHDVDHESAAQIIGRAQRFGRKSILHVIYLLDNTER